jgi:hypothetical protein
MSRFAELALEKMNPKKVGLNTIRYSRAGSEPLVMLELVVASELQKKGAARQVCALLLN